MNVLNYRDTEMNLFHVQGYLNGSEVLFDMLYELYIDNKLEKPNDLSIITTHDDDSKSTVKYQLDRNNIPFINCYRGNGGIWNMVNKIYWIYDSLSDITTKYILIVDSYDVFFKSFDNIIEKFLRYNTRILFNATKNKYPAYTIDRIPYRDYLSDFNNLNAGCVIGYKEDLQLLYKKCIDYINSEQYFNPFMSEQAIVRNIFKDYSSKIYDKETWITIDYLCDIFAACGTCLVNCDGIKINLY